VLPPHWKDALVFLVAMTPGVAQGQEPTKADPASGVVAAPPNASVPRPDELSVVRLHVSSPASARVMQSRASNNYKWTLLCAAPCDQYVDAGAGLLKIEDDHLRDPRWWSQPLLIANRTGDVAVTVHPGDSTYETIGGLMAGFGVLVGPLVGTDILICGFLPSCSGSDRTGFRVAGAGMLLGGTALAAGGLALLFSHLTSVDVLPKKAAERRPNHWMGEF
jgi:hypothetical protein